MRDDLSAAEQAQLDAWIERSDENRSLFSNMTNSAKINADLEEIARIDTSFAAEGTRATNHDGRLVYDNVIGDQKITYHTIIVPKGGEYQLRLSDGTKVWMNAAPTLRYPTQFASNESKVELTGEAYFEVAGNKQRPFIVSVDSMSVRVTGTEFNINAYKDETLVKSTWFQGKVKIKVYQAGKMVFDLSMRQLSMQ
ncbi:MAG: FecR family protein [Chitinophagaceae bacterium]